MRQGAAVLLWSLGLVMLVALGIVAVMTFSAPVNAQIVFATNTPRPPDELAATPQASLEQYALRLWVSEDDLLSIIHSQIMRYNRGESDQLRALLYSLFELEQRFPAAPQTFERREALVGALLPLPLADLDTRAIFRPYAVAVVNRAIDAGASLTDTVFLNGVEITPTPLNFNNDERMDALLHVRMTNAAGTLRYEDYLPVIAEGAGYRLISLPDLPAYPFNGEITLALSADLTSDRVDEVALWQDTGEVNARLWVVGWRNGAFVDLVAPETALLSGAGQPATLTPGQIAVYPRRVESPLWNCQSQITERWEYRANYFRIVPNDNPTRTDVVSVGCSLYRADPPLFSRLASDAAAYVSSILSNNDPSSIGYAEAQITLAMLTVLNNDIAGAQTLLDGVTPINQAQEDQMTTLRVALASGLSPVQVCASMLQADGTGGCDLDAVIGRILTLNPVRRDGEVRAQLESAGLPVAEVQAVSQVGQANRTYVRFELLGAHWWVFAPTLPEVYVAEAGTPPPGYVSAQTPPPLILHVPPLAFADLIEMNDPLASLTVLENVVRELPDVPLALETQYFQAFLYDRLGRRALARDAYYALWKAAPDSAWGQLAGAHLEYRGS